MADRVAGPVEAGRLAVPHAEHAVVLALGTFVGELAAHHRRGGELLVDAGAHDDREVGHGARRPADLLTQRADGRALVAGHEGGGVQAVAAVDAQLVDGQPGDGLDAGQEDPAVLQPEAVGELVAGELRRELVSRGVVGPPVTGSTVHGLPRGWNLNASCSRCRGLRSAGGRSA